jgi:non-specific serine/threonine protein kinase
MSFTNSDTFIEISNQRYVELLYQDWYTADYQNFLVDNTGHVKLTDFGLATGTLNPQRIESMRHKVWPCL